MPIDLPRGIRTAISMAKRIKDKVSLDDTSGYIRRAKSVKDRMGTTGKAIAEEAVRREAISTAEEDEDE